MKKRIIVLTGLNLLMIGYVVFMFYKSEPEYTNDVYRKPVVWDYVSVNVPDSYEHGKTVTGVVIQTDSSTFSIQYKPGFTSMDDGGIRSFPYKGYYYKIIGKGTFYHKVNSYIGFNIMFITICIVIVFFAVVFYTEVSIIWQILNAQYLKNE